MSSRERREEKRLQRVFRRALLVALAAPFAAPAACSSQSNQATGGGAAPSGGTPSTGTGSSGSAGTGPGAKSTTGTTSSSATTGTGGAGATASTASGTGGGAGTGGAPGTGGSGIGDGGAPEASCAPVGFMPNPPDTCGNYVRLPCGLPADITPGSNCYLYISDCSKFCPSSYFNCHAADDSCVDGGDAGMVIMNDSEGGVDLDCSICAAGVGRVPAGLVRAPRARAGSSLGDHFAAAAHLEDASVHAFRLLHAELEAHGAPAGLLRATRRAERDEVRHARVTARLARRFGGAPAPARVAPAAERPFDDVALENAVEGCVRETFGALVASFQAERAADPAIRRAMKGIARDETRHAALSWAVARWASKRTSQGAEARLRAACRSAIEALRREAGAGVDGDLALHAGVPGGDEQRALLSVLQAKLWGGLAA